MGIVTPLSYQWKYRRWTKYQLYTPRTLHVTHTFGKTLAFGDRGVMPIFSSGIQYCVHLWYVHQIQLKKAKQQSKLPTH